MTDYKTRLDEFQKTLPALIDQKRPDLTPEVRALLVAIAPHAWNGLLAAVANGPERLKAVRLFFDLCGVAPLATGGNGGGSTEPSDH